MNVRILRILSLVGRTFPEHSRLKLIVLIMVSIPLEGIASCFLTSYWPISILSPTSSLYGRFLAISGLS